MAAAATAEAVETAGGKGGGGMKKLILIALPLLLGGIGAGLWFSGILPSMLGMGAHPAEEHGQAAAEAPRPPTFFEMPEIIANLNATGRRPVYVKLRSKLEITRAERVMRSVSLEPGHGQAVIDGAATAHAIDHVVVARRAR